MGSVLCDTRGKLSRKAPHPICQWGARQLAAVLSSNAVCDTVSTPLIPPSFSRPRTRRSKLNFPHAVHFYFRPGRKLRVWPSLLAISTDGVNCHPSKAGYLKAHYMRSVQLLTSKNIHCAHISSHLPAESSATLHYDGCDFVYGTGWHTSPRGGWDEPMKI